MEEFQITLDFVFNFDESPCRKGYNGYYTVTEKGSINVSINLGRFERECITVCPLVSAVGGKYVLFILFKRILNSFHLLPPLQ